MIQTRCLVAFVPGSDDRNAGGSDADADVGGSRVTRLVGAGGFLRFSRLSGGNVDLPSGTGEGTVSVDAGGLQLGAGLRIRF